MIHGTQKTLMVELPESDREASGLELPILYDRFISSILGVCASECSSRFHQKLRCVGASGAEQIFQVSNHCGDGRAGIYLSFVAELEHGFRTGR